MGDQADSAERKRLRCAPRREERRWLVEMRALSAEGEIRGWSEGGPLFRDEKPRQRGEAISRGARAMIMRNRSAVIGSAAQGFQ